MKIFVNRIGMITERISGYNINEPECFSGKSFRKVSKMDNKNSPQNNCPGGKNCPDTKNEKNKNNNAQQKKHKKEEF